MIGSWGGSREAAGQPGDCVLSALPGLAQGDRGTLLWKSSRGLRPVTPDQEGHECSFSCLKCSRGGRSVANKKTAFTDTVLFEATAVAYAAEVILFLLKHYPSFYFFS